MEGRRNQLSVFDASHSARAYWDRAAETYAQDFSATFIGKKLRGQVWDKLDRTFLPGDRLLELNCGTGIDALHLAAKGIRVMACDISEKMIEMAHRHAEALHFSAKVDFRVLATERLATLDSDAPFDGAFSNFSGLNCVEDLGEVRRNLGRLIKPGAMLVICMLGQFVPWEMAWYLARGDPDKAIRRLQHQSEPADENGALRVHYRSRREVVTAFAPEFRLRRWGGIGIFVPPIYTEQRARRYPQVVEALDAADRLVGHLPVFRTLANFMLLEFQRSTATRSNHAEHLAGS